MAIGYSAFLTMSRPGSAVSAAAASVRRNVCHVAGQFHRSEALFGAKARCIATLHELAMESSQPNWDGYEAEPVNPDAVFRAENLIASLPDDLDLPECSVEPDGCISLDWFAAPHRTLSISIGDIDRFAYAWVDGSDRGHAVARMMDGQLPPRVLQEIRRFSSHESALRFA